MNNDKEIIAELKHTISRLRSELSDLQGRLLLVGQALDAALKPWRDNESPASSKTDIR